MSDGARTAASGAAGAWPGVEGVVPPEGSGRPARMGEWVEERLARLGVSLPILHQVAEFVACGALVRATGLLVTPVLYRFFTLQELGVYFLSFSLLGYGVMVLNAGLNRSLMRLVSREGADPAAGRILAYRLGAGLAAFGALGASCIVWPVLRSEALAAGLVVASVLPACLSTDWALMGLGEFRALNKVQIGSQLIYVTMVALAAAHGKLWVLALAQLVLSTSLALGTGWALAARAPKVMRQILASTGTALRRPLRSAGEVMRDHWVMACLVLGGVFFNDLDLTLGGFFLAGDDLGIAAALSRLSLLSLTVAVLMNEALFSLRARDRVPVASVDTLNLTLAAALIGGFQIFAPAAVGLLFGPHLVPYTLLFRVHVLGILPACLFHAGLTNLLAEAHDARLRSGRFAAGTAALTVSLVAGGAALIGGLGLHGVVGFAILRWGVLAVVAQAGLAALRRSRRCGAAA